MRKSLEYLSILSLCIYGLWLLIQQSQNIYLADSEIFGMSYARYSFKDDIAKYALVSKSAFYTLLKSISLNYGKGWDYFLGARLVFAITSFLTLILSALLAFRFFKSKLFAATTVVLTLSTFTYLNRGIRVRSDNLAIMFFFGAVLLLVFAYENKKSHYKRYLFSSLVLIAYSFISTPKAIFLVLAFGVLYIRLFGDTISKYLKSFKIEVLLYVLISVIIGYLFYLIPGVKKSYIAATNYFSHSFMGPETWSIKYFSPESFFYLAQFLRFDYIFAALLVSALFWSFIPSLNEKRHKKKLQRTWAIITLTLVVVFILIPDKLPFYLSSLLPIFSIQICFFLFDLTKLLNSKGFVSMIAVLLLVLTTARSKQLLEFNNNKYQGKVWSKLNSYLNKYPNSIYYDAIGLFPYRNRMEYYPGPGLASLKDHYVSEIIKQSPEIFIFNNRMRNISIDLYDYLNENYSRAMTKVFVKTFNVEPKQISANKTIYKLPMEFFKSQKNNTPLYIYPRKKDFSKFKVEEDGKSTPYKLGMAVNSNTRIITKKPQQIKISKFSYLDDDAIKIKNNTFAFDFYLDPKLKQ